MRVLLDTHLLIWIAGPSDRLPEEVRDIVLNADAELLFSTVSIWEVAIKQSLGRADFQTDSSVLRRELLDDGYIELPVLGEHAVAVAALPTLHKDPFDRMLIAQAVVEGAEFLTVDGQLARYPGPIRAF